MLSPQDESFINRSTRGASKQRRDQINEEINRLRELLPLSQTSKERLFQLQVMSLACVYIRKELYSSFILPSNSSSSFNNSYDIYRSLRSFLLITSIDGRLFYISDNASEFIGHSVEELMCQGDSLLDMIDGRDIIRVKECLSSLSTKRYPQEISFVSRFNLNRTSKRHLHFQKYLIFSGRTIKCSKGNVLLALSAFPLLNPDNIDLLSNGSTNVFTLKLSLDLKLTDAHPLSFDYLSISRSSFIETSIYSLVHPEDARELEKKHRLLIEEPEGSVILLIRLSTQNGEFAYFHIVFTLTSRLPPHLPLLISPNGQLLANNNTHHIVASIQSITDNEAYALRSNPSIYSNHIPYSAPNIDQYIVPERPLTPTSPIETKKRSMDHNMNYANSQIKLEIPYRSSLHSLITPIDSSPDSSSFISPISLPQILPELGHLDDFFKQNNSIDKNRLKVERTPPPSSSSSSISPLSSFNHNDINNLIHIPFHYHIGT